MAVVTETKCPTGFTAIGLFFWFGATMSTFAAITLLHPGTFLDSLWVLNRTGHAQLVSLGTAGGAGFAVLSALMSATAVGWFRRRHWAWLLGTTIIAINAAGDLINGLRGEWWKGTVGLAIAGFLLFYMTRDRVRKYFERD